MLTAPPENAQGCVSGIADDLRARSSPSSIMGQVDIELIEPVGEDSVWHEVLAEKGEGVHHIAFQIKDTEGVTAFLDGSGIPTIQQGHYTGGMYSYVDSGPQLGVMLELLENFGEPQ